MSMDLKKVLGAQPPQQSKGPKPSGKPEEDPKNIDIGLNPNKLPKLPTEGFYA